MPWLAFLIVVVCFFPITSLIIVYLFGWFVIKWLAFLAMAFVIAWIVVTGVMIVRSRPSGMNADPMQQRLAVLLATAGASGDPDKTMAAEIIELVANAGWESGEADGRIAHALSMVKIVSPPAVYRDAVKIGQSIVFNFR